MTLLPGLLRAVQRLRRGLRQARQAACSALGLPRATGTTVHASARQLRALAEHGSDLVAILDMLGAFSYVSPSHERGLGYKPAQLVGTSAFDLVHPDDRPGALALFTEGIRERGAVRTTNLRVRHADGSWRWLEIIGNNRLLDPAVRGVILNCRDITDRVRIE